MTAGLQGSWGLGLEGGFLDSIPFEIIPSIGNWELACYAALLTGSALTEYRFGLPPPSAVDASHGLARRPPLQCSCRLSAMPLGLWGLGMRFDSSIASWSHQHVTIEGRGLGLVAWLICSEQSEY